MGRRGVAVLLHHTPLGPLLTVASGGITAMLLGDAVQRFAPVTVQEAAAMIDELQLAPSCVAIAADLLPTCRRGPK